MDEALRIMDTQQAARDKEAAVSSSCAAHIAHAALTHLPSHRSSQLCVLGMGMNLDGAAAHMIYEESRRSGPDHVFAVVLPDKVDGKLVGSLAKSLGYQLGALLRQSPTCRASSSGETVTDEAVTITVHVIREGTGTKERCQAFQKGGVVVTTSKMLCADLLHHRLAPEVIAVCIVCFPSVGVARTESFRFSAASEILSSLTNLAFCMEIILRGGSVDRNVTAASAAAHARLADAAGPPIPKVILLSDNPIWMQYLLNRHHVGRERFTALLHIGDIQLYPRFRLSIVEHFEGLATTKPLVVDRSLVGVSEGTRILDDLLQKVLLEVLSELRSLERRLCPQRQAGVPGAEMGTRFDGDDLGRLQPRVRARVEPGADGSGQRIEYESSYRNKYARKASAAAAAACSEPGKHPAARRFGACPWRNPNDPKHISFTAISEDDCQETETAELDTDLAVALDANGPRWPYKLLVESLLDLRRLRRAVHYGSQYDFIFTLQDILEKRTPRLRAGSFGSPAETTALWTLSTHFNDIVTVATHRIGRVEEVSFVEPADYAPVASTPAEAIVVVDSDGEDGTSDTTPALPPHAPPQGGPARTNAKTLVLVPSSDEHDNHLLLSHRLAVSWMRDQKRKLAKRASLLPVSATPSSCSSSDECAPILLIIVVGRREVQNMMRRLRYTKEEFRQQQLTHFLERYQRYYGISVIGRASDDDAADGRVKGRAASAEGDGGGAPAGSEEDELDADGGFFDAEAVLEERSYDKDEAPSPSGRPTRSPAGEAGATQGDGGGLALHHILLSQTRPTFERQPLPDQPMAGSEERKQLMRLEYNSNTVAILVSANDANPDGRGGQQPAGPIPRVVVVDSATLRSGDLLAMVRGEYGLFREIAAIGDDDEARPRAPAPAGCPAVRRVILTQQSITLLREIEVLQDELDAPLLQLLKVQLVATTFSDNEGKTVIEKERAAFQSLANAKATLTGRMLMDRSSVRRTEELLEAGLPVQSRGGAGGGAGFDRQGTAGRRNKIAKLAGQFVGDVEEKAPTVPLVIFDEREFRSMLPYHLYTLGIDLIPLTLNTADFVLSPHYGLERKSVSDFFQSVMGAGRINEQLTALARRYQYPLLLIEFDRGRPFRLIPEGGSGGGGGGSAYRMYGTAGGLYPRMARMVAAHPRVAVLWSRSPAHSAGMVSTLKLTVAADNPDPSDPTLTGGIYAKVDDDPNSDAAKAILHYAKRVLATFPGVNPTNAEKVMRLCGSLVGLAELSKDSLVGTMGEEDGEALHDFLHAPFTD